MIESVALVATAAGTWAVAYQVYRLARAARGADEQGWSTEDYEARTEPVRHLHSDDDY